MSNVATQPLDEATMAGLLSATTGTLSVILLKKGLRNCFIRGAGPQASATERRAGRAFTLRFISAREDLFTPESLTSPKSARAAIESMPSGVVCVAAALGVTHAGVFGDILCSRMRHRGVVALVTDGAIRDAEGVARSGLPVWSCGTAASPSVNALTFINWQEPIDCGGVAIFPNDVIVADADGAVVIPSALLESVVAAAVAQESLDSWVLDKVNSGEALPGLYPPNKENLARYEASKNSE
jgi:regulator of RNase E activity RraA